VEEAVKVCSRGSSQCTTGRAGRSGARIRSGPPKHKSVVILNHWTCRLWKHN